MTAPAAPDARLTAAFARPARIVAAVLRILLAVGFTIVLVLKVYMVALTDHACLPDGATLGNTIRCTPVLVLLGQVLALSAALELALRLLLAAPRRFLVPFTQALLAFLVLFLARVDAAQASGQPGQPTWEHALFLLAAGALLLGILWLQGGLPGRGGSAGDGSGEP